MTTRNFKLLMLLYLLAQFHIVYPQQSVTIGSETLNDKAVLMLVAPGGNQGLILPVANSKEAVNPTAYKSDLGSTSEITLRYDFKENNYRDRFRNLQPRGKQNHRTINQKQAYKKQQQRNNRRLKKYKR